MEERNLLVDAKCCRREQNAQAAVGAGQHEAQKQDKGRPGGLGRLPAEAPLANPYVPFQLENPPKYEAGKGLIRGTLFPGLDLPFMGMVNTKEHSGPEAELRALAFAIQELALYLDTHRDDREALDLYRSYQELYEKGEAAFVKRFGPLNHMQRTDGDQYQWLEDPWPWDYQDND